MASYLFFLGRSTDLAEAELSVFFPTAIKLSETLFQVDQDEFSFHGKNLSISEAIKALGGVVKIAEILGTESAITPMNVVKYLIEQPDAKITFGISTYEGVPSVSQSMYQEVKEILEQEGRKVRFVLPKEHHILSSVVVSKQDVIELNVVLHDDACLFSKTVAIQEFEEWASRDYDRPYFDSKKGMLPPKAARMAVNIALGTESSGKTLLDPFCGMGTIPGEAVLLGAIAMGSDNDTEAIEKAKKNSIWLRSNDKTLPPITYFVSDATHISDQVREGTIDAIVTEPFMGTPKLGEGKITDKKDIRNALKGLEKLYIGCLREWHGLLKPNGVIVMAFPDIVVANTVFSVKNVIDSCETLGYTKQLGPLGYSRPQAVVRRMFYVLRKK